MKHRVAGRKLGRVTSHRQALLRNLSAALIDKERITTTLAKAKELRPFAERLVTLAKRETLHARRRALRHVQSRSTVAKLFDTLSARYAQRSGGYTRILKLGVRRGDNAEMAIIEFVGAETVAAKSEPKAGKRQKPKADAPAAESAAAAPAEPKRKTAARKRPAARKAAEGTGKAAGSKAAGKTAGKAAGKRSAGGRTRQGGATGKTGGDKG
jgi:large subunit ribosomal protein L17